MKMVGGAVRVFAAEPLTCGLALLLATLAVGLPLTAHAQPPTKAPRIGALLPGNPATAAHNPRMQAF
jgi:hypothetical protein